MLVGGECDSPAGLDAVVTEEYRLGKLVAAHAHGRQGIAQGVAARVDTIEHCSVAGPDRTYARISTRPW